MARALLKLAKWVGTPIALGAVGYFLIGPRVGALPEKAAKPVEDLVARVESRIHSNPAFAPRNAQPAVAAATTDSAQPPTVDNAPAVSPHARRHSRESAPPDSDGPQVEVSVDGAAPERPVVHHATHRKKLKTVAPKPAPKRKPSEDDGSYGGIQDPDQTPPPGDGG